MVTAEHTLIRNFGAGRTIEYPVDASPISREPSIGDGCRVRPDAQLDDRRADPATLDDVAAQRPEVVEELSGGGRARMATVDDLPLRGAITSPYTTRATRDLLGADH